MLTNVFVSNLPLNLYYFCYNFLAFFTLKGRKIATKEGSEQFFTVQNTANNSDDPIFSVGGDLAINWWYGNNGARIALTGGHLSAENIDDDNTHGLGNHFSVNGITGKIDDPGNEHEISNIQDCPYPFCPTLNVKIQGTDHGDHFKSGPVYGNYALYVSKNAQRFPVYRKILQLEMENSND